MRRLILLILLLILLPRALPAHAQTDCQIELENAILRLIEAQRAADQGNDFTALADIEAVRAELASLSEACQGLLYPLPERYTAPDSSVSFAYPAEWIITPILDSDAPIYLVTPNRQLSALVQDSGDELIFPEGEQALFIFVTPIDDTFQSLQSFGDDFADSLDPDARVSLMPLEDINGRDAWRIRADIQGVIGYFDVIDFTDAESPAVIIAGGFANPLDEDILSAQVAGFANGVQYPPLESLRVPGVDFATLQYETSLSAADDLEIGDFRTAALAPDGSALAYFSRESDTGAVCLVELASNAETCAPLPPDTRVVAQILYWSPDSQYIAFTGDFFRRLEEVDIMIFDRQANQIFNATDDGIDRWSPMRPEANAELSGTVWIDTVPTWGPDNNLYFIRGTLATPDADMDTITTALYRLAPDGSDAELIRDLTDEFERFSIFDLTYFSLDGVMSIAPDLSQIAFIVRPREMDSPLMGVYTMPLDGSQAPTQILTPDDILANLTPFFQELQTERGLGILPTALTWTDDSQQVVVWITNYLSGLRDGTVYSNIATISLESGEVAVLRDLSFITSQEHLFTIPEDANPADVPYLQMPRSMLLAPDFSAVIGVAVYQEYMLVTAYPLDGSQAVQVLYSDVQDFRPFPNPGATIARDGTILAEGHLFIPAR